LRANKILKWILVSIILAFFIYNFSLILSRPGFYQWDFKTFYYAAKAHASGLNPYGVTSLSEIAKKPVGFRFRYPPQTLLLLRFFSYFNLNTAYYLFLALKCCLLAGMFLLWTKIFLKREADIWFYPFALLAFNTSIFVDIAAGNISIFEQFGLWLGFFFLLKRRLFLFCLAIVLIANFKITPLFFLVLLLFIKDKKKYLYFFASLFTFGMIQAVYYIFSPLYQDFLIFGSRLEKGWGNPSSFSLLRNLMSSLAHLTGHATFSVLHVGVYAIFVAAVLVISWRGVITLKSILPASEVDRERMMILLACLVYAVVVPRFIAYSQIILIVPAYFVLRRLLSGMEGVLLFILIAFQTPQHSGMPGMDQVHDFIWTYYSVLVGLGLLIVFLLRIFRSRKDGAGLFVPSSPPTMAG